MKHSGEEATCSSAYFSILSSGMGRDMIRQSLFCTYLPQLVVKKLVATLQEPQAFYNQIANLNLFFQGINRAGSNEEASLHCGIE
jgi:hypothetical protein